MSSSRNSSNCALNGALPSDIPQAFDKNKTGMCGFSWPSDTPFNNISTCCEGPVQVSNGCFQYCPVKSPFNFNQCVIHSLVQDNVTVGALGTTCNHAEVSGAEGLAMLRHEWLGGLALVGVVMHLPF